MKISLATLAFLAMGALALIAAALFVTRDGSERLDPHARARPIMEPGGIEPTAPAERSDELTLGDELELLVPDHSDPDDAEGVGERSPAESAREQIPVGADAPPRILSAMFGSLDGDIIVFDVGVELSGLTIEGEEDHPDGPYSSEWPSTGKLEEQGEFLNNRRVGHWIHGYPSGEHSAEGRYVAGEKHGPWTRWWPHGVKRSEGSYVYGQLDGPWMEYHQSGEKKESVTYVNGQHDGHAVRWHANGQKSEEGTYVFGDRNLTWRTWHPDGQEASRGNYEYGTRIGSWRFWSADGELDTARSGYYENGEKVRDGS